MTKIPYRTLSDVIMWITVCTGTYAPVLGEN